MAGWPVGVEFASECQTIVPSRIGPLAVLPLFHRLAGRKAVVVGRSHGAAWKAELLAAAGAEVERIEAQWNEDQLVGVCFAVAEFAEPDERALFRNACHRAGALVNLIDEPQQSDVLFGSIVNRTPVVIGISTDGAAPMLGQSIRSRIEVMLPPTLAAWAQAAKAWRPRLKHQFVEFSERRQLWQRFVDTVWKNSDRNPVEADFRALIESEARKAGNVTFLTADLDDPELLTVKAVRSLQSATVIVHDYRFGTAFLNYARREARTISVRRSSGTQIRESHRISAMVRERFAAGENVVVLAARDNPLLSETVLSLTQSHE